MRVRYKIRSDAPSNMLRLSRAVPLRNIGPGGVFALRLPTWGIGNPGRGRAREAKVLPMRQAPLSDEPAQGAGAELLRAIRALLR